MTKRYVLTGGPGSGKTSIILALEAKGEYVIREAAEDVIRLEQAKGNKEPWKDPNFQYSILKLQMQREDMQLPKNAKRIFIDRGYHDGLAYEPEHTWVHSLLNESAKPGMYDQIFMIDPIPGTYKTAVRREDMDEALKLFGKIEQVYREHGYKPRHIQHAPLEKRVDTILRLVEKKPTPLWKLYGGK